MSTEFRVLGPLEVLVDGEIRPVPAAKLRILLAALLLNAPQPVSAAELIDVMWGEEPPATARNAVQIHIGRLRRLLGDDGVISTVAGGYAIRVDSLDVVRFRDLVDSARVASSAAEEEVRLLREALEAFHTAGATLRAELGISPGSELCELQQGILTGSVQVAAPEVPVSAPTQVVPQQLPGDISDFVGRSELVERLVGSQRKLAVVSGPPGVGKTAFAVRVAHLLKAHFPDGQLHANLHGYSSGTAPATEQVLARFLRALGVSSEKVPLECAEQSEMLRSQLAGRRVLLLLDNVANIEQVRAFLPDDGSCCVLVTSRDTLRELADDGALLESLGVLDAREAQALLGDLLGAQRLQSDHAAGVELADLCGNLPLALRIAGANLASQDRTQLSQYVRQLRDGDRLAALAVDEDEQAAVRATFDLSYTSLDPELRRFFRLLGLQPGPDFTARSAAELAEVSIEVAALLLDRLASVSLVHEYLPGRYQFHDLVRLFAQQQSTVEDAAAERDASRGRLFDFYAATAHDAATVLTPELYYLPSYEAQPKITTLSFADVLDSHSWFDAERANLIAIIVWTTDNGPQRIAWYLASALTSLFRHSRDDADWRLVAGFGLRAAMEADDTHGQAAQMRSRSMLHWCMGDNATSLEFSGQALSLYREVGDLRGQAQVLSNMGVSHAMAGDQVAAVSMLTQSLTIEDGLGVSRGLANCLLNLGTLYAYIGKVDLGVETFTRAKRMAGELKVHHVEGVAAHNLAILDREAGRFTKALEGFEHTLALWRRMSSSQDEAAVLDEIAVTEVLLGRYAKALTNANAALRVASVTGNRGKEVEALNTIATAHLKLGQPERALPVQQEALRIVGEIGYEHGTVDALIGLSAVQRALGQSEAALRSARDALSTAVDNGLRLCEPRALTTLAQCHLHLATAEQAVATAEQALPVHRETRQRVWEAWTVQVLGLACRAVGNNVDSAGHLRAAHEMFVDMG